MCLVCDPDPGRAQTAVRRMLAELGAVGTPGVAAACAPGWAAAVVPPAGIEPTCGADIHVTGRDVLLWTGEIFLPADNDGGAVAGGISPGKGNGNRAVSARLLAILQRHGLAGLADCDGAFCGAWFDAARNQWSVFGDKLGMLPVFWRADRQRLIVGPKAWLTWLASGAPLAIDSLGVAGMLRTQNAIDDRTLISGVRWLNRGHALVRRRGAHELHGWWDLRDEPTLIQDERAAADAYVDVLRQCLERHTATRGPLLLGISGGLDSRLFLAVCEELGRIPACFSSGFAFAGDVRFGRQLARLVGASHDWSPLDEATLREHLRQTVIDSDGLHNLGHLPPSAALRPYLEAQQGAVLLEGFFNGAAGGSMIPGDAGDLGRAPHERTWAQSTLHAGGTLALIDALLEPGLSAESRSYWADNVDQAYAQAGSSDPLRKAEYAMNGPRRSRKETLGTTLLRGHVLVRSPATDLAMIRWHQAVPPSLRRSRRLYLDVLCRRFPRFARVPRSETGGMPIASGRWLREYHWQREKLYRMWAGRHHPALRRWGPAGDSIRGWTFQTLLAQGAFEPMLDDRARVYEWVRRDAVMGLWSKAITDPLTAMPLMGLLTVETMVRWLESHSTSATVDPEAIHFERIETETREAAFAEVC